MADATNSSQRPTRRRRWWQFSLRAFLLFITFAACVAGWIGIQMVRHKEEEAAIEHLVKGGSTSTYWASRFKQPPTAHLNPAKTTYPGYEAGVLNKLREGQMFRTVVMFAFHAGGNTFSFGLRENGHLKIERQYKSGLTDDDMRFVTKLVNLRSLWLEANNITDRGLVELCSLDRLEYLWLQNTPITDAGLTVLANFPQLQDLDLSGTDVSDGAVPTLVKCRQLRRLGLANTSVTAAGIAALQKELPDCQIEHDN